MTVTVDLITYSDADLVESFYYQTEDGDPIDLTNHSLRMMVRKHAEDATAQFECTTFNGRIWYNDAAGGAFTLTIPVAILEFLRPGEYVHSLIATEPIFKGRTDLWRGRLVHSVGPTRWELNTL